MLIWRLQDAYRPAPSINQILGAAFQILTYEKVCRPCPRSLTTQKTQKSMTCYVQNRQSDRLGASVFGPNEVYTKLKAFKSHLTGGDASKKL